MSENSRFAVPKDRVAQICALRATHTAGEAALALRITRSAVCGMWHRYADKLGVPRPKVKAKSGAKTKAELATRAEKKAPPVVAKPVMPAAPLPVRPGASGAPEAIAALRYRDCRFPIGHPAEPDFRFCCAPAEEGRPYCADHLRITVAARVPLRMPAYTPMGGGA